MADVGSDPVDTDERPAPAKDKDRAELAYGIVMGMLYVVAVGIQVYIVVDEVTHGALTEEVQGWWRRATARWADRRRLDAEVRSSYPWMLWQVHEILDVEGRET